VAEMSGMSSIARGWGWIPMAGVRAPGALSVRCFEGGCTVGDSHVSLH
jgi:hypothetical protein